MLVLCSGAVLHASNTLLLLMLQVLYRVKDPPPSNLAVKEPRGTREGTTVAAKTEYVL